MKTLLINSISVLLMANGFTLDIIPASNILYTNED